MSETEPRGIRNHNPGNIRRSDDAWLGKVAEPTDDAFEQFESPEYGIRALVKIIRNYRTLYDLETVAGIIGRWAPPHENDTEAYIESVCNYIGCEPDETLDLDSVDLLHDLAASIIRHENGQQPYSRTQIESGIAMALA